jgi:sulfide:quinone oxidoreductase
VQHVERNSDALALVLLAHLGKTALEGGYDGYASCPLTTAVGKTILAEFIYGGKVTPTLPLNPAKEHWVGWWIPACR